MFGFLAGEALRDLVRAGWLAVSAVLLITLSLLTLGAFWILSANLGRAVGQWREQLRIVVYLKDEPSAAQAAALGERIHAAGGVARVEYVSKSEALRRLKVALGAQAAVADTLPNPLPASFEVTPDGIASSPAETRALVERHEPLRTTFV